MDIIEKYNNPTKHVQANYGTIHRNESEYFIQVSKDPENPNWLTMGTFLVACFKDSFSNETFIKDCLATYDILTNPIVEVMQCDIEDAL